MDLPRTPILKDKRTARPFLKWAGGKQQLLAQYEPFFPQTIQRYIEPFIGGGAVFFHLWNTGRLTGEILLFDNNEELVNAYSVVKTNVEALIDLLLIHKANHNQAYFYQIRSLDRQTNPLDSVQRAARTIYLNKTCYNGLYRVNSKGQFNAPVGRYKNPMIVNPDMLRNASRALQRASIKVHDFRSIVDLAQPGDVIYFDPPYAPLSKTASFTGYTANSFSDRDQQALAEVFSSLSEKKCKCLLSNSCTPLILDLYQQFRIEIVHASRAINSVASRRGNIKEVFVLNY